MTCFLCPLLPEQAGGLAAGWLTRLPPSFLPGLVYLFPSAIRTHRHQHGRNLSLPTKQNTQAKGTFLMSASRLPNNFYFMPLWQSHPIRLKYPGLERLSPESFSKGASHRPLNPPHFMVQIFNSSERVGGETEENSYKQSGCSPHRCGSGCHRRCVIWFALSCQR